jgi:hypothetical protein
LETKRTILSRKNDELLELSKKHRELTELVSHAKGKFIKQQRRLARKPNIETLRAKAADQLALFRRLSEAHAVQASVVCDLRREIGAIESSIKLTDARLSKVLHQKLGYVEESRRLAMDLDIQIARTIFESRRFEAPLVSRIERLEKCVPRIGRVNPFKNAQIQFDRFERMVLEKEGQAEKLAPLVSDGLSLADSELIERVMVKLDRAVEVLDYHVSAMFALMVSRCQFSRQCELTTPTPL